MASPVVFPFQVKGQKDVENAFKSIAASAEKSSKSVVKSVDTQEKALDKLAKKSAKVAAEVDKDRVASSKSATDKIIADYERQAKAAEELSNQIDRANEKIKGKTKTGGGVGGLAIGSFIGGMATKAASAEMDVVSQAVRESAKLDEMANRISISARGYGQKGVDKKALRKSFEETAIATPGIKSEEVAAGTAAFVSKTGRLDIAQKMQQTFATTASATGAKVEEIATAAADLFEKFDIKSVDEMQRAFAKLAFQGKEGSFELKDAASQFAKLSAAAGSFNIGKGEGAVATLGGLTQIAKRATGSPEAAATAVENMFSQLTQNAGKLKQSGVNVFNKDGSSRNIQDILTDTITNVGKGDFAKKKMGLQEIFGKEGIRAVNPLISIAEEAYRGKKAAGGSEQESLAASTKAIRDEFEKTINVAASWEEIQKDAAQAQTDSSAQINSAWESVKAKIGEDLLPAISGFVTKLTGGNDTEGLIDPLITVFVAIAEAGELAVDALKELGLVKPKEVTKEQAYKNAKKEEEKFNEELAKKGLGATSEDIAKRDVLAGKTQAAYSAMWEGPDAHKNGVWSKEDFIKEYGSKLKGTPLDPEGKKRAESVYDSTMKGESKNDWWAKNFENETADARDVRHKFSGDVMFNKLQEDPSTKLREAASAQKEAAIATKEAADALSKVETRPGPSGSGPLSHQD